MHCIRQRVDPRSLPALQGYKTYEGDIIQEFKSAREKWGEANLVE